MRHALRVLILEDRPSDAQLMVGELRHAGFDPVWERVDTEEDFAARLDSGLDLILADYSLPQFSAPLALQAVRQRDLDTPFIIVSGSIGEEIAVAAIKEGATDYLLKDRLGRLGQAVSQALEQRRLRNVQQISDKMLRERTQFIVLSAEVGIALNRPGTLQEILQQASEVIVQNLGVALARIWVRPEAESVLVMHSSAGLDTSLDGPQSRVRLGSLDIGRIALQRRPFLTSDVAREQGLEDREWAERHGLSAFAGLPLIVEDRLVGALALFARQPFTAATQDALSAIANQIAAGIDRKQNEERRQLTQFTIDHIDTAIFWSGPDGRIFNVNDAATTLSGHTRDQLLALNIHDVVPNAMPLNWPSDWRNCQRHSITAESMLRHEDGAEIPVSITSSILQGHGREYRCTFVQDISERKATELAQWQSDSTSS